MSVHSLVRCPSIHAMARDLVDSVGDSCYDVSSDGTRGRSREVAGAQQLSAEEAWL